MLLSRHLAVLLLLAVTVWNEAHQALAAAPSPESVTTAQRSQPLLSGLRPAHPALAQHQHVRRRYTYPLRVSSNQRHLEDATGVPFFLVGDSVWGLMDVSLETAKGYLRLRASQGFNSVQFEPAVASEGMGPNGSECGCLPFTSTVNGQYDITTPNPAYWATVDALLHAGADLGFNMIVCPYDNYNAYTMANPASSWTAFGQFLGQRYANYSNVMWSLGNDAQNTSDNDANLVALLRGIQQHDTQHIVTFEGWYQTQYATNSFDDRQLRPFLTLNGVYWYAFGQNFTSASVSEPHGYRYAYLGQYNRRDFGPIFNIETYYAGCCGYGGILPPAWLIRDSHYSILLNGGTGDLWGNNQVYAFTGDWKSSLTSNMTSDVTHFSRLLSTLPWYSLVPDHSGRVFKGVGVTDDYSGAYAFSGALAAAYKPGGGAGAPGGSAGAVEFTVDMSFFAGPVMARWFDPTAGKFAFIGSFGNTGLRNFTAAKANAAGDNDFLLILSAVSA